MSEIDMEKLLKKQLRHGKGKPSKWRRIWDSAMKTTPEWLFILGIALILVLLFWRLSPFWAI